MLYFLDTNICIHYMRKGHPIGNNDMLIAATALSCNATLVTNNTQEFSRIDSLNLTDWTI